MAIRTYLTGTVGIEYEGRFIGEREFPGRQGRLLFACLVAERHRAIPQEELAQELWGEAAPASWNRTLSALVSKLRSAFQQIGRPDVRIEKSFGCYQLIGTSDLWVDIEAASQALEEAEASVRKGRVLESGVWSQVAYHVFRRPFLIGENSPWASRKREEVSVLLVRSLDCLTAFWLANGEHARAAWGAGETVRVDPFHEAGYQNLMRAHMAAGDRVSAIRVYEKCRRLLVDELGVDPSPDTEAVYLQAIQVG